MLNWTPPDDWTRIHTLDVHAAGEPLRIVLDGFPDLPGDTILAKRRYAKAHHDDLRRALMWEPRGHRDMYGCILTPPVTDDGDTGVLFMHNAGFSTMCGHGVIGLVTAGVQSGQFPADGDTATVKLDTPAGRVVATAHLEDGNVQRVSFLNVPSFVFADDFTVDTRTMGPVSYTLAFGGAFYAYVDWRVLDIPLEPANIAALIEAGRTIKDRVNDAINVQHPDGDPDLNFVYGTIFTDDNRDKESLHSRNVCIFADGEVDRSPTGTGVSGRAAILHAHGELAVGETISIESILGTRFDVKVAKITRVGNHDAIVPEVSGSAYITGRSEFYLDPNDPLREGFILG